MDRSHIYWNSIPPLTNKQLTEDINHRMQLIRNMEIPSSGRLIVVFCKGIEIPASCNSTEAEVPVWSQRTSTTILRRKNYKYAISLPRGRTFVLHFSVFQHDVGFSSYFNSNNEKGGKSNCIEVRSVNDEHPKIACSLMVRYVLTCLLYLLLAAMTFSSMLLKMAF